MVMDTSGDKVTRAEPPVTTESQAETGNNGYIVREKPLGSTKPVRIVIIGAGASGLNMIRTLRLNLTNYEVIAYEKNADIGGTWLENRYPGCRCDIPSHSYQFSWRPNKKWTSFFGKADEIEEYLCKLCDEEGLRDSIKTEHQVVEARWDEDSGVWKLVVRNLKTGEEFTDQGTFLIDGTGILNKWKWPDVEGRETYKGTLIHTARWPQDFDHSGKVIAVIGNGSTGTQVLPELQPGAQKLYHIFRTPTWTPPPLLQSWKLLGRAGGILDKIQLDAQGNFLPETLEKFETDPAFYKEFITKIEVELASTFPAMLLKGPIQAFARTKVVEYMTAMLGGNEALCKALIPDAPLGFRRMTPSAAYPQALTKPNVEVRRSGIRRFVPEGLELDSGEVIAVDAIVCATGYETSFRPLFPIIGRDGNLQQLWDREVPKAYMSCAVAGLPNYFVFFGPNSPIAHGSVFTLSEHMAKYFTSIIKKCQTENIKAITPSKAAVDDYMEHISTFMPRTAWSADGRSWFKRGQESGPVTALHPGSRTHFFHMLEKFRGEDWEYVYDDGEGSKKNRFAYLGNGLSTKELDPQGNVAWYLDSPATQL